MPTFGEMTNEVISTLQGHSTDNPSAATLAGDVTDTSGELALDFGSIPWAGRPNGLVEIDDELIFVSAFDATSGVATVPPWGRGQRGTTAAAHDADSMVTIRPRYPRAHVKSAINSTIRESCPPLFAAVDLPVIETSTLLPLGYTLPENTMRVLRVEATDALLADEFACRHLVRDWTVRAVAGTQLLELNRSLVYQNVQVTVAATPTDMVADGNDFATTTGLPVQAAGMAVYGSIARLILGAELAKQQQTSVEASARNDKVQSGSATTISRYYQALYTQRLEFCRDLLAQMYPPILLRRG